LWTFQVFQGSLSSDLLDFSQAPKLERLGIRSSGLQGITLPVSMDFRPLPANRPPIMIDLSGNQLDVSDLDAAVDQVHQWVTDPNVTYLDGGSLNISGYSPTVSSSTTLQYIQTLQNTYGWTVTF
ncbi:MAG: hypothetical protein AAFR59_17370, partial [Bacteroidota bacterium]